MVNDMVPTSIIAITEIDGKMTDLNIFKYWWFKTIQATGSRGKLHAVFCLDFSLCKICFTCTRFIAFRIGHSYNIGSSWSSERSIINKV